MQHHGAPTRPLDWTKSSHVGAYFAVDEEFDLAAIWAVDLTWLNNKENELLEAAGRPPYPFLPADRATYVNSLLRKAGSMEQPKMLVKVEPKKPTRG